MQINKGTRAMNMTRGDSAGFYVLRRINNKIEPLIDGDTVYFTVKENVNKAEKVLQKVITVFEPDGKAYVEIEPADTKGLKFGDYVYDIQITKADGKVHTIVKPSKFTIDSEVTYE